MRLYRLIGLEIDQLTKEHEQTVANIFKYEDILEQRGSMEKVIEKDLLSYKKNYASERKTDIINAGPAVVVVKKEEPVDVYFVMDRFGYAKTIDQSTFDRNQETVLSENRYVIKIRNDAKVCLFTDTGLMHTVKVSDLPLGKLRDKGVPVDNVSNYSSKNETIILVVSQSDINLCRFLFVTKKAMMKIVSGGEFDVVKRTIQATSLQEGDSVMKVAILSDQVNVVLQTQKGYFIKFPMDQIPEKKKNAVGVRGMKLTEDDELEEVYFTKNLETTTIRYKDKDVDLNHLKLSSRDGRGTKIRV